MSDNTVIVKENLVDEKIRNASFRFRGATTLEDVLCLTVLVARDSFGYHSTVNDARDYWLNEVGGDCNNCPHALVCMACLINE